MKCCRCLEFGYCCVADGSIESGLCMWLVLGGVVACMCVGRWGPLKSVKGRVRRWHDLSEVPVGSPWKSPPSIMMWSG